MRKVDPIWCGIALLALSLTFALPSPSQAGERYYLIIFGAQSHPKLPRNTHTFATFVKVGDCAPGATPPVLHAYTISWLPQTLKVRPFRCHDEPGVNLTLEQTLAWACENNLRVSEWGPYEIEGEFYENVYNEYLKMQSGQYRYKAIDPRSRGSRTTDCIHAVSDMDPLHGRDEYFLIRTGDSASRHLVVVLFDRERVLADPGNLSWIDAAVGLNNYPIVHRPDP